MTTTVLVLNCGSSSIKYQLVDVANGKSLAKGVLERIGEPSARLRRDDAGTGDQDGPGSTDGTVQDDVAAADHEAALDVILRALESGEHPLSEVELAAVGHRVVHGGDRFAEPVLIDDDVEHSIDVLSSLAPLHNPPNLAGVRVARRALPHVPHVAVFDTAFHQTLPPSAYTYALESRTAAEHGVRRYGFHGTSVSYVSRAAARLMERSVEDLNLIVLHLGNGASATAVRGGRSVDTSMGLTPLEGLVMGTRTGDIDAGVLSHLRREAGLGIDELDDLLNRQSGLLGLAGANDMREVHRRARAGDEDARLAREVYCHRVRHYVGAYLAVLGQAHAVVFTAGVGENDAWVRSHSLSGLRRLGIEVDHVRNSFAGSRSHIISPDGAEVAVLVVPTDEEFEIARQALDVAAA
ncbi:acetate kinase [Haloactinopolyspora alba]|uniref:Acetate kinase n=1 Tax=Haloactinopolyspora alba TaxID=648780 RepID=A0A2P8E166_9ACTN|nr:acetate kinase [Haloactinopolyspora alba]PSL03208.1 acetate kinase [Haloactinopolyspora alba]